jgi:predicted heme/steroid binding protein
MPIEGKANEIRDSEAYQDTTHEGHQDAVDKLTALYEDNYGTESAVEGSRTLLDQRMEEALEDLHGNKAKKPDLEARLSEPVVEGGAKFGDPMKMDEGGNPVSIMDRPDLYKLDPDELVTEQDRVDAITTSEEMDEYMKSVNPNWTDGDHEILDAFVEFSDSIGIPQEHTKVIFDNFVRSPEFGKTYTQEDGLKALLQLCGGDQVMADTVAARAVDVVSRMPAEMQSRILDDTKLGNNPRLVYLLSSLIESKFGSDLDDLSISPYDMGEE